MLYTVQQGFYPASDRGRLFLVKISNLVSSISFYYVHILEFYSIT